MPDCFKIGWELEKEGVSVFCRKSPAGAFLCGLSSEGLCRLERELMEVMRKEIYRYLGIRGDADARTRDLVESVTRELQGVLTLREFHQTFPLTLFGDPENTVDFTAFRTKSRSLTRNLRGCGEVILLAATIGPGPDRLMRRYEHLEISRAAVMQAASAALIEAWCRQIDQTLREEAGKRGLYLRPRFSPGYGDFSLECQVPLLRALSAERRVGITLTESCLMLPSKSVSAVIGVSREDMRCVMEGCEICGKTDCLYRRDRETGS